MDLGRDRKVWELICEPREQRRPMTRECGLHHGFVLIAVRSMLEWCWSYRGMPPLARTDRVPRMCPASGELY